MKMTRSRELLARAVEHEILLTLMNTDGDKTAQIVDSDILSVTSDFLTHAGETISY